MFVETTLVPGGAFTATMLMGGLFGHSVHRFPEGALTSMTVTTTMMTTVVILTSIPTPRFDTRDKKK